MPRPRTSTAADLAADPLGEAVAEALTDVLAGATVQLSYARDDAAPPLPPAGVATASATGAGPPGWHAAMTVGLDAGVTRLVPSGEGTPVAELLHALPRAGLQAAAQLRDGDGTGVPLSPALRRTVRDVVAAEILDGYLAKRVGRTVRPGLVAETIEFLIELSGTRVESHDLTHGVVVADVLHDRPRLEFRYPGGIRAAKRAPLLFDGRRALLVVDPQGRARTEFQSHRFERVVPSVERKPVSHDDWVESGSLVAEATSVLGGLGFFVRADRSIWTFVDGRPLLVRRAERWTAFPLELSALIENMIGGGSVAALVARAAVRISAQPTAPSSPSSTTRPASRGSCRPRTATTCATRSTRRRCGPRHVSTISSTPKSSTSTRWCDWPCSTVPPSSIEAADSWPMEPW